MKIVLRVLLGVALALILALGFAGCKKAEQPGKAEQTEKAPAGGESGGYGAGGGEAAAPAGGESGGYGAGGGSAPAGGESGGYGQ